MKARRPLALAALLAGFSCVWASPSMSFNAAATGEVQRLKWKGGPIKLALSSSLFKNNPNIKADSDVAGAVKRATEAWQDVANIEFKFDRTERIGVSPAGSTGDGMSLITASSTAENALFFSKDAQAAAAKTRVFYNRKGVITEADIALNPFQQFSTDGTYGTFDLQTTLTHEIGHLLGLRHSEVAGSIMFDNVVKNADQSEAGSRSISLSESDVAAVRETYGTAVDEDCCSSVSGTLTLAGGRPAKSLRVWAEESETGRVVGQGITTADGSYAVGGLKPGKYNLYWKSVTGFSAGEIGTVELRKEDTRSLDARVVIGQLKFVVEFIGLGGVLSGSAVDLNKHGETIVTIAGKELDKVSKLTVTSPFLRIDPVIDTSDELVDGRTTLRFYIQADHKTPAGVYSIFATSSAGDKTSLVGVLRIR